MCLRVSIYFWNSATRKHYSACWKERGWCCPEGCCPGRGSGGVVLFGGGVLSREVGAVQGDAAHNINWHHNTPMWTEWLKDRCKKTTVSPGPKGQQIIRAIWLLSGTDKWWDIWVENVAVFRSPIWWVQYSRYVHEVDHIPEIEYSTTRRNE